MFLLDGVVGEVTINVARVVGELLATGAQVTLLVPVGVELAGGAGDQDVTADVEFPVAVE